MTTQFRGLGPISNPITLPNNIQATYAATSAMAPSGAPQNTTGAASTGAPPAPSGCGGNLNVTV